MLPFELVATATASPRYSPAGSFRKFATGVKGISGTPVIVAFCWADAEAATSSQAAHADARYLFMTSLLFYQTPGQGLPTRKSGLAPLRGVYFWTRPVLTSAV